ncbi:MAG: tRNA (adenosine(37)-N6)-threonylcarbamoyltransferase complex transferase subunit TsaD [Mycoplasmataceae bacterium]|nr:tRNA (adenosine(37)-N6)-threonylcarbamoyltransferase complex transferase subunit TsaD [Mycoplasmataceae bacterium]
MKKEKIILGIETSCDDTSLSLFKNSSHIDTITSTSSLEHEKYGGIIPEIAARKHEEVINDVFLNLLKKNNVKPKQITHIAYTAFPGLAGSLHVGKMFAKTLSFLLQNKLVPIDHMNGHAFSYAIDEVEKISFPLLSLVISGGNTILYLYSSCKKRKIINQTTDDAIGECLDKIGRVLGFSYPGGIELDKNFDKEKSNFKTIKQLPDDTNFSFSGIKSFATNFVNKNKEFDKIEIGSSCLKWCMQSIINKLKYYSQKFNVHNIAVGGGVAANSLLKKMCEENNLHVYFTKREFCGDNATMIGFYASLIL